MKKFWNKKIVQKIAAKSLDINNLFWTWPLLGLPETHQTPFRSHPDTLQTFFRYPQTFLKHPNPGLRYSMVGRQGADGSFRKYYHTTLRLHLQGRNLKDSLATTNIWENLLCLWLNYLILEQGNEFCFEKAWINYVSLATKFFATY